MKKLIIFAVITLVVGAACSKDEEQIEGNKVTYTVSCNSCTATFDTINGTTRTFKVKDFVQYAEVNKLQTINLSTTGEGEIKSTIKVNDKVVHESVTTQTGNTITFAVKVD